MAGGSAFYKDGDTDAIVDINVTPMVDVMLVLLVIFMVTAPLIAARGISVNVPTTSSGDPAASPLQVSLRADGALFVNGKQFDEAAASVELARLATGNPDLKAIVSADSAIPYGDAMRIINLVKAAGISKLTLATKRPGASK
jgi:biopolymer transport protein TolR